MKKIRSILIAYIVFVSIFYGGPVFAVDYNVRPPEKAKGENQAYTCVTYVEIKDANYYRCATMSPKGYSMYLWNGTQNEAGGSFPFNFKASTDFKSFGGIFGDIGEYLYKQQNEDYYITVEAKNWVAGTSQMTSFEQTHHFRTGRETRWNQFASANRLYRVVKNDDYLPSFPEYKNAFQVVDGKKERFVWRIVVNGKIKKDGEDVKKDDFPLIFVKIKLDDKRGPALAQSKIYDDGTFEFSRKNATQEIWVSSNTVKKMALYIGFTINEQSYEKYIDLPFDPKSDDWKVHADKEDTLIRSIGTVNFTDADKVEQLSEDEGGEQNLIEETLDTDACGKVSTNTVEMIRIAFCGLGMMIKEAADKLMETALSVLEQSLSLQEVDLNNNGE